MHFFNFVYSLTHSFNHTLDYSHIHSSVHFQFYTFTHSNSLIQVCTHLLTYSSTHTFIHSLNYSHIYAHLLTWSFTWSLTNSQGQRSHIPTFTCSLSISHIHSPKHIFTHPFAPLFIYLLKFTYSNINIFIHSLIHKDIAQWVIHPLFHRFTRHPLIHSFNQCLIQLLTHSLIH